MANVHNRWTVLDGNNDTYTWMFYTNLGQAVFGDFEICAEYIVSPTLGNTEDADEWLISPPLAFEAGEQYELTVSGRSYSICDGALIDELLDVYIGNKNTLEAMTEKLGTMKVSVNGIDPATETMAFKKHVIALPTFDEDATRCIGLNLVTPITPSKTAAYLQINAIYVGKVGEFSGVTDVAAEAKAPAVSVNGRTLTIFGDFTSARLYNMQGAAVADICSPVTSLADLNSGIYILCIDGKSFKLAL